MDVISKQLQNQRITKVVKLAGPRYEKEVNIELPVRSLFHALIKSEKFCDDIIEMAYKLAEAAQYTGREPFYSIAKDSYDQIKTHKDYIIQRLKETVSDRAGGGIREQSIVSHLIELRELTHKLIDAVEQADKEKNIIISPESRTNAKDETNQLYDLVRQTYEIISFFENDDFMVFNRKSLLLKGEAGIGKTHLFCDFAKEAYKLGHPTYIFLGEEFAHDTDPLRRIAVLLGSTPNYDQTFQSINNAANRANKRAVILIDAVNEAKTKVDWSRLNELKKYKNISFAVSVRTGYERVVLATSFLDTMKVYNHPGLDIGRIEDIVVFFTHFKVPMPDIPLIAPEFRNPLFIKIFCKTYDRKKTVRGDIGSTTLFEDYIRKQSRHVLRDAKLPRTTRLWDDLVKPVATWMSRNGTDRILEKKAKELIELAFPHCSANDILTEMQRHWLLTKTPHYTNSGSIRGYEFKFPYQKFSDHLIVRYLLNHHLDKSRPEQSFLPNKKLGKIIDSKHPFYNPYYGLVEALSIQVPERLKGRELVDIAPSKFKESSVGAETFLNSLLWRDIDSKNGKSKYFNNADVLRLVNYYMYSKALDDGFDRVLETVLSSACIENHPLDAFLLHSYLSKIRMPQRDAFWQQFVHYRYGEGGSIIDRYLHWAESPLARKIKSETTVEQTAIVLSWFLASSNRRVRDKSTKALVNLLDGRYSTMIALLKRFNNVDDVYIVERLYAVAYGCALREPQPRNLKQLATHIYTTEFKNNHPRVHILIRDYAKGIVELYHRYEPSASFNEQLYLPPYKSQLSSRVPSEKTLEKKYPRADNVDEDYGSIRFSVESEFGDFGKDVIKSNLQRFTAVKIDGSSLPSERDRLEAILQTLTPEQLSHVDSLKGGPLTPILVRFMNHPGGTPDFLKDVDVEKIDKDRVRSWRSLRGSLDHLSSRQATLLKKHIDGKHINDNSLFDIKRGSRWVLQRTMKLGWSPKLHGEYDKRFQRYGYGDEGNKPESIGRKYQWQAVHEFLAIVADHYKLSKGEGAVYEGSWQLHVRDIDPSCMIKSVENKKKLTWWSRIQYDAWRPDLSEREWLEVDGDLPDFKQLIRCKDRKGKAWVNLETFFGSEQQISYIPKEKRYNYRRREMWAMLKSYIIKENDLATFFSWIKDKNFEGRWLPESHEFYDIFYREYPHQPAFKHLYAPYYGRSDWHNKTKDIPVDLMVTDDEYLKETSGYDMSTEAGFSIKLPAKSLYTGMDLRACSQDGAYRSTGRETVFFDPHIYHEGPATLLGSLKHLATYLEVNNYVLIWTVLGEKQVIGGGMGRDKDWPGRLEFSGAYYLDNKTLDVKGGLHLKNLNTRD